jgi:glutamyl-Q tRNA(Asp) synthetase
MSVFRFAPSPNGYLHLGHAFSALLNADMAKAAGGRLLLRIEDIDEARCRPQYEKAIYEDLAWLGVTWEQPVRRQSEHYDDYRAALRRLEGQGLVYPSFESRAEIAALIAARETRSPWPRDPDGAPLYPGDAKTMAPAERERRIAAGAAYALRLDMQAALARIALSFRGASQRVRATRGPMINSASEPGMQTQPQSLPLDSGSAPSARPGMTGLSWQESGQGSAGETGTVAADPAAWGDVILARKDMPTSYHLSVVVDDAAQGVTDVVRGRDLFPATGVHRLLQALLGLSAPRYHHHRLILDSDGKKLSKSSAATGLRELRARGVGPAEIRRLVGLD